MLEKLIVTIAPSIIAGIITYKIAIKNIHSDISFKVANEQLKNVYLPLFVFLEPYLYKKPDVSTIVEFIELFETIKKHHYELIDSNLMNEIQILKRSITSNSYNYETYDHVCSTLDNLFEKTRRFLKLPNRNISYKINNRQYNNLSKDIFLLIKELLIKLILIIFIAIIFSLIYLSIGYLLSIFK